MYAIRKARARRSLKVHGGPGPADREAYFDPRFRVHAIKVLPGEFLVTDRNVMLVTVLGSCVSACINDPDAGIGGMNHFMLPGSNGEEPASETARYGSYAMEMLINELLKRGAHRDRLQVKVFGGGNVLPGFTVNVVGDRNVHFVLDYIATEGLKLMGQDLLGTSPRRVHYFPRTGRAMVKQLSTAPPEVYSSEERYFERLQESPTEGLVELFEVEP